MAFGYLRDPLFLACLLVYGANRMLEDWGMSPPVFRSYLNDVICIPFWLPLMLWAEHKLGLRPHDDPPYAYEIVIPLVFLAAVFEVILPSLPAWRGLTVPDPNDVLCYAAGAFLANRFWQWRYRAKEGQSRPVPEKDRGADASPLADGTGRAGRSSEGVVHEVP